MGEFSGFALVPEQGAIPQKHQLDPDMQRRIEAMAARVDIRDNAAVMGFGARAQKEMGTFSDIALEQMLRQDIKPLESVMQTLAEQINNQTNPPGSVGSGQSLGVFRITHYCPCYYCSGGWGSGTATGTAATPGRTIAVDPSVIPYGSVVVINGHAYVAEDCGGAIKGNRIDIYVSDHTTALSSGTYYAEVYLAN